MVERHRRPVVKVTAITHRRSPMLTSIPVGLPPSESNGISRSCRDEEMPPLALKNPWYGYTLGLWGAEDDAMAEAVAQGEPVTMRECAKP